MKKKKRRIFIAILLVLIIAIGTFLKLKVANMDFSDLRANIQAWVDSGKNKDKETDKEEEVIEEPEKPEEASIPLTMPDGSIIKGEYKEENGVKVFTKIEQIQGFSYSFSPSMQKVLILDKNQEMKIFNVDGTSIEVTKKTYTAQNGNVFNRNDVLVQYPSYIWTAQAKFVDETHIIYMSNLPYVGNGIVDKYIWIVDLTNNSEKVIYALVGTTVTIGDLDKVNGIKVTANNVTYFVRGDGTFVQESDLGSTGTQNNINQKQNTNINTAEQPQVQNQEPAPVPQNAPQEQPVPEQNKQQEQGEPIKKAESTQNTDNKNGTNDTNSAISNGNQ